MPWKPTDAKQHIKGLSPSQEQAWATIANKALADCQKTGGDECEGKAIRIANAAVKRVGKIAKTDDAKRLAFGWAYIAKTKDGDQVTDHSGEFIETAEELEDAVYEYVETSRESNDMHTEGVTGRLVESFVSTPEKLEAMGLEKDALPTGVWVGFRLDDDVYELVKAGNRRAFSIEGSAVRVEV